MDEGNIKSNANLNSGEARDTFFHEFFGPNSSPSATKTADDRSSAVSTVSEQVSEKQVANHLEGIPFYSRGSGSSLTWSEMSNRSAGNKRSMSDSVFMGSSRDGSQYIRAESSEGLHLMKVLRNVRTEQSRPNSTPHLLGLPSGSRTDPGGPRWDRSIPLNFGPTLQHVSPPVHTPFSIMHKSVSRYKDGSAGTSGLHQLAADEGSRTGMKESGILGSIIGGIGAPSGMILTGNKSDIQKPKTEQECSTSVSQLGSPPGNRQMTIFYNGQAHVFDDVHPNKAEVIMEVAGSNGGSWSTSFGKSATPLTRENLKSNEADMASKHVIPGQFGRNLSITGSHRRDIIMNSERGATAEEIRTVQKREV